MKKLEAFLSAFLIIVSLNCFAQQTANAQGSSANGKTIILTDNLASNSDYVIKSYYVEERINKLFGGRITTYEVTKLDMVYTNDLGPNNTRTIIPRYVKRKQKGASMTQPEVSIESITAYSEPVVVKVPAEPEKYVKVDVTRTYERVLEKGYKSPEMLQKVADRLYFEGNFNTAAGYYEQLFNLVKDPDVIYYYRYAQSLKSVNQIEKADLLMKRFKSETLVVK
ncbi:MULTISPECIES: hypothetical protein [unclassified Flavobacterium]|uniref:hypothetical protein n=1 Tax=unclassified Flavobacterium TaxID=196869 RepID=UPI00248F86AB|nr:MULTISPECIES: hypothetical protein [unclassified Flavobacterium]MDQ1163711.1 hypothetical protein [Flavobacterium sp. SORGH_AS_0622]BDU24283.1 hypothetical protein FLGSB24_10270 [Flavobacterium sp. GSB-24]